jgi:hypothetical protein
MSDIAGAVTPQLGVERGGQDADRIHITISQKVCNPAAAARMRALGLG